MNVSLLLPEGAAAPESLPAFMRDTLRADLKLDLLLDAVAMGDKAIREAWAAALFSPLLDPALLAYRHEALGDAREHPEAVRSIYALCSEAVRRHSGKGSFSTAGWTSNYDLNATFRGAVESLTAFTEALGSLRTLAEKNEESFRSRGFRALFRTLKEALSEDYLEEVRQQLAELRNPEGLLVSARLGDSLQGVSYVLQRRDKKLLNLDLVNARSYHPDEKDEPAKDMAARRERAVNGTANALAQSAIYLAAFFERLRAELAFFVGCLNFTEGMASVGMPVCLPVLTPPETDSRAWEQLYDVSLVVMTRGAVTGNDLRAEHKKLYMITGANQGGKTTFLRSLGIAQLMAQAGMPVGARSFVSPCRRTLFAHFKREEDRWMDSGKLDEELGRMRRITDSIRPGDLLLMNESFASTGEAEASEIARQVTEALLDCGVEIFSVTHLHTYALAFLGREDALFLRAQRREDGERTHRLVPGEPLETAFGEDLYNEVFLGQRTPRVQAPETAAPSREVSPPQAAPPASGEEAPKPASPAPQTEERPEVPHRPRNAAERSMLNYDRPLSEEELRKRKRKKRLEAILVLTVLAALIFLWLVMSIAGRRMVVRRLTGG